MMRKFRSPIAMVSFLLALAVCIDPKNVTMFATCCLIATVLALLEMAKAIEAHRYSLLSLHIALVGIYSYGFFTVGHV